MQLEKDGPLKFNDSRDNLGALVMDCFCGSGTTLEAAMLLGRRFLGIDIADAAIKATVKRLDHGRSAMGDFVGVRETARNRVEAPFLFDNERGAAFNY